MMRASLQIGQDEYNVIDDVIDKYMTKTEKTLPFMVPKAADQVYSVLDSVDPLLNETTMYHQMEERAKLLDYLIAVGLIKAAKPGEYIVDICSDTKSEIEEDSDNSVDENDKDDEVLIDKLYNGMFTGDYNPDDIFVSAAHTVRHQGVKAENLA